MEKAERSIQTERADEKIPTPGSPSGNGLAAGSEGPVENGRRTASEAGPQPLRATTPVRELSKRPAPPQKPERSGLQRTLGVVRTVLPLVGKALPLLEGNVAAVLANILAPTLQGPPVDLKPMENGLERLSAGQAAHQARFEEQGVALKRMGAQIETVSEAVERHSLDQKELTEELYSLRRKLSVFAWIGVSLLVLLLAGNALLLLHVTGIWH